MPSSLSSDEQIQQLTMTIKSLEKDGLIFYVTDDPVGHPHSVSSLIGGVEKDPRVAVQAVGGLLRLYGIPDS